MTTITKSITLSKEDLINILKQHSSEFDIENPTITVQFDQRGDVFEFITISGKSEIRKTNH
jgi:hypothetical protein